MDLQQRVERLERQNRWLTAVAIVALIAVGLLAFLRQPRMLQANNQRVDTVKANKFILEDNKVNECMTINNVDGVTMFEIHSTQGNSAGHAGIVASDDAYFWAKGSGDKIKKGALYLRATKTGSSLELRNQNGVSKEIESP